jgi:hypothetical protein
MFFGWSRDFNWGDFEGIFAALEMDPEAAKKFEVATPSALC